MQRNRRIGTAVITSAAALGLAVGTVGVGWAISPATTAPSAQVAVVSETAGPDASTAVAEPLEAVEATETAETTGEVGENLDPSYATSISAPQDEGVSEADEATGLESLATITPDEARDAALAAVPGTIREIELDNENGAVVYSVEITDSSGSDIEVKVDAGTGAVVRRDADDGDSEGEGEG